MPKMTSKMFNESVSSDTENLSKENVVDCLQFPHAAWQHYLQKSCPLFKGTYKVLLFLDLQHINLLSTIYGHGNIFIV